MIRLYHYPGVLIRLGPVECFYVNRGRGAVTNLLAGSDHSTLTLLHNIQHPSIAELGGLTKTQALRYRSPYPYYNPVYCLCFCLCFLSLFLLSVFCLRSVSVFCLCFCFRFCFLFLFLFLLYLSLSPFIVFCFLFSVCVICPL